MICFMNYCTFLLQQEWCKICCKVCVYNRKTVSMIYLFHIKQIDAGFIRFRVDYCWIRLGNVDINHENNGKVSLFSAKTIPFSKGQLTLLLETDFEDLSYYMLIFFFFVRINILIFAKHF